MREDLRALGAGADYRTTIGAAARAARDPSRSARFLADGGGARLARALVAADRADDRAAVQVGRAARRALRDEGADAPAGVGGPADDSPGTERFLTRGGKG